MIFLIFFEAIFVAGHSLKAQSVHGLQVGIRVLRKLSGSSRFSIRSLADWAK